MLQLTTRWPVAGLADNPPVHMQLAIIISDWKSYCKRMGCLTVLAVRFESGVTAVCMAPLLTKASALDILNE
jgi:hypothetical protein